MSWLVEVCLGREIYDGEMSKVSKYLVLNCLGKDLRTVCQKSEDSIVS